MVKILHVPLNDSEWVELNRIKGDFSWHEFLLEVIRWNNEGK